MKYNTSRNNMYLTFYGRRNDYWQKTEKKLCIHQNKIYSPQYPTSFANSMAWSQIGYQMRVNERLPLRERRSWLFMVSRLRNHWISNISNQTWPCKYFIGQVNCKLYHCLLHMCYISIAQEHWPDTCEFITRSAEFKIKKIRFSCYYNRV